MPTAPRYTLTLRCPDRVDAYRQFRVKHTHSTTTGTILSSEIEEFRVRSGRRRSSSTYYRATLLYSYNVSGIELEGKRIYHGYSASPAYGIAEQWTNAFRAGDTVPVYVDRHDSGKSVLVPSLSSWNVQCIIGFIGLLSILLPALFWLGLEFARGFVYGLFSVEGAAHPRNAWNLIPLGIPGVFISSIWMLFEAFTSETRYSAQPPVDEVLTWLQWYPAWIFACFSVSVCVQLAIRRARRR